MTFKEIITKIETVFEVVVYGKEKIDTDSMELIFSNLTDGQMNGIVALVNGTGEFNAQFTDNNTLLIER